MIFRFMRILVFFDLPTETALQRRTYAQFRKFLICEGFIMLQQSVYVKLALNASIVDAVKRHLHEHAPPQGLVQLLVITEKQYTDIQYIVGKTSSDVVDSTDRYVIL